MGLLSRRRNAGFDPDLWSDADDRARDRGADSWFGDLTDDAGDVEPEGGADEIETNAGAQFADADAAWLADDPGEAVRRSRR